jgi:hypothetical protein
MRVFFEKAGEVFQMSEPTGHRERTSDHLADGLLHWLNFDFHQAKLNRIGSLSSTGEPKQKRRGLRPAFVKFCPHLSQRDTGNQPATKRLENHPKIRSARPSRLPFSASRRK